MGDEPDNDDREDEFLDFSRLNGLLLPKLEWEGWVATSNMNALQGGCGQGRLATPRRATGCLRGRVRIHVEPST